MRRARLSWAANIIIVTSDLVTPRDSEIWFFHFLCCREVVEPPELLRLSYVVDLPKQDVAQDTQAQSDTKLADTSESKSSLRKSKGKQETEAKPEAKVPEASQQESSKERKEMERPPIFITLL